MAQVGTAQPCLELLYEYRRRHFYAIPSLSWTGAGYTIINPDKNKLDSIEPLSRARFSCIKYIRLGTINSNSADVQILDGRVHNKYDFVDHKLKQAICYQWS